MSDFDQEKQKVLDLFNATEKNTVDQFRQKIEKRASELDKTVRHVLKLTKDAYGVSLLHAATNNGNLAICEWLLSQHISELAEPTKSGDTLMHSAVISDNPIIVQQVYNYMVNEDLRTDPFQRLNNKNVSPALIVVENELKQVFEWMIGNVKYHIPSKYPYMTPLQSALFRQDFPTSLKIIEWMTPEALSHEMSRTATDLPSALVVAGSFDNFNAATQIVEAIIQRSNTDIIASSVDPDHTNVALNATEAGNEDLVKYLLTMNPQAFLVQNRHKKTALDVAPPNLKGMIASATEGLTVQTVNIKPVIRVPEISRSRMSDQLIRRLKQDVRKGHALDCVERIESLKAEANAKYQSERYEESLDVYRECLSLVGFTGEIYDDDKLNKLVAVLLSNISANFLKLKENDLAIETGKLACAFNEDWAKSFFRVAQAYKEMNEHIDAIDWLFKASTKDKAYNALLAQWTQDARHQHQ